MILVTRLFGVKRKMQPGENRALARHLSASPLRDPGEPRSPGWRGRRAILVVLDCRAHASHLQRQVRLLVAPFDVLHDRTRAAH